MVVTNPVDRSVVSISQEARAAMAPVPSFFSDIPTPTPIANRINPGERCIIAEDVVTTGVSSLETKRVIEENGGICVGIACVVDRTRAEAPSPIPIVASALKLDLPNYAPEECPICKEGKLPLVHLGSRKMKEAAKQTL